MQAVVFAIHLIVSLALVGVILLQRSEGGALGIGGGNNAMVSGRGAASLLTRTTAILAGLFFVTSLTLAALAGLKKKHDVLDINVPVSSAPAQSAPLTLPEPATNAAPAAPAAPAIPAPTPEKSSALELAPKVSGAAAAPEAKAAAKTPAKPAAKPAAAAAAKPAIPEPTPETAPAPESTGPTTSGGNDAGGEAGGAGGPQPR